MDNATLFVDIYGKEHIIIDFGNNEFLSMPKENYEKYLNETTASLHPALGETITPNPSGSN